MTQLSRVLTVRPACVPRLCCPVQARNAALRREKELMARHYGQLKAALDRGRAAAAERLKQLSVMSGTAMQVGPSGSTSAAHARPCHSHCLPGGF
jgi:hypothetical protein